MEEESLVSSASGSSCTTYKENIRHYVMHYNIDSCYGVPCYEQNSLTLDHIIINCINYSISFPVSVSVLIRFIYVCGLFLLVVVCMMS